MPIRPTTVPAPHLRVAHHHQQRLRPCDCHVEALGVGQEAQPVPRVQR